MLLQSGRRTVFPFISRDIARIAGVSADEVMGDATVLDGLLFEEDRERFYNAVQESAAFLEPLDVVVRHHASNGEVRWIHHCSTPHVLADESVLWDGLLLDVTAERLLEEELLHVHDRAVRAEREMRHLLAKASHQIRNALSPIPYGLALMEYHPGKVELERQVADTINTQVDHIARLLDSLEDGSGLTLSPPLRSIRGEVQERSEAPADTPFTENERPWRISVDMPHEVSPLAAIDAPQAAHAG